MHHAFIRGGSGLAETGTVHLKFTDDTDLRLRFTCYSNSAGKGSSRFCFPVGIGKAPE